MLTGIDISNQQGPPSAYRDQPWYKAAQFVIVQAIEPPAGFPGSDHIDAVTGKRGYTGEQLLAARQDGKKIGVYAWLWCTLPNVTADIAARFECVPTAEQLGGELDMRPWVDVEDEAVTTPYTRQVAVDSAKKAADEFAAARGLKPSGGYSRDQYVQDFLGGYWPQGWVYWQANYTNVADPNAILPARPARQFADAPADMDEMADSEVTAPTLPAEESEETLNPIPQNYLDNGWTTWYAVAVNLQGIATDLGGERDQAQQQNGQLQQQMVQLQEQITQLQARPAIDPTTQSKIDDLTARMTQIAKLAAA